MSIGDHDFGESPINADLGGGVIVGTADCCCGGTCPPCICASVPNRYSLTVSGITDGRCLRCDEKMNGTFILTKFQGHPYCEWISGVVATVDDCIEWGPWVTWYLKCWPNLPPNFENYYQLCLEGNGCLVSYRLSLDDWSCLGVNVLNKHYDDAGTCAGWPATLTLIPV